MCTNANSDHQSSKDIQLFEFSSIEREWVSEWADFDRVIETCIAYDICGIHQINEVVRSRQTKS